ncbi:MAG: DNA gyrase subunit A, partial [Planctomycetota bacterium]
MTEDQRIQPLSIEEEMKGSYLTYAMSVIIQRALPDVRDGLKPSQRRILVAMNDLNLGPRSKHRKCAKIAGDTSGNYHPHGESVIYPTLVRMAQDFNMREPLVDPQGNFGSIDGDPPAAMRYTEARMTAATPEMLEDLDKDTVDFARNYDDTRDEPTVLPAKFPNLLVNGGSGIAVGMATSFAPHNLREVGEALLAVLDNPDITLNELMEKIPGPDFPTGGVICGKSGILAAYTKGKGILTLRAKVTTEEKKKKTQLVVTEIPYQVSKSKLASDIANGVKEGRLTGISDVRDESDSRTGIRLVIELKRGENDEVILNQLFKHTPLQTSFSIQQIALVNGRPRTLSLRELLLSYRDHRTVVIRRRARYLLEKAEYKAHILEGYLIALDNIDRIIELIRNSHTVDDARSSLMGEFGLTRIQSDAILQMRLQRLTGLERLKIEEDLAKTREEIEYHRQVLTDDGLVTEIIREDIHDLLKKFPSKRRSRIEDAVEDIDIGDLISEEQVVVTLTHQGYVKRTPLSTYRSQGRGGSGISGGKARDGDFIKNLYVASTHDQILFFSNFGKVYWLKVYEIPDMARTSLGRAIVNLLPLQKGEEVLTTIQVKEFDERMLVFSTRNGIVKKTALKAYSRPLKTGIIAIRIEEGDSLIGVSLTRGDDEIILSSARGMAIRFAEGDVREMGRASRGVRGIDLQDGDQVVGMTVVREGGSLLTICQNGYGKRTSFSEYRTQRRGGKGLIDIRTPDRNGPVVTALALEEDPDVMMMTQGGMLVRISVEGVREIGRNTMGIRLIRVRDGDRLVGAELVEASDA